MKVVNCSSLEPDHPPRHVLPRSSASDVDVVHVQVADRPGELSRLMAHTGEAGVNIEDLRLDHDLGRPVGLAEIAVAVGVGEVLVRALTSRGWTAYL